MKYIYAIRSDMESVKFGVSQNPIDRLNSMQTGNESQLVLAALCMVQEVCGTILEEVL